MSEINVTMSDAESVMCKCKPVDVSELFEPYTKGGTYTATLEEKDGAARITLTPKSDAERAQDDDNGELETIYDCIVCLDLHRDDEAAREKAVKTARRLLCEVEQRLDILEGEISGMRRAIGSGVIPF